VARGVAAEFPSGSIFGAKGMDSYAAFPLNDGDGTPLGLLVAMDRQPIADANLAEALLKIFTSRIVADIERARAVEALRAAALAVSSARGDSVFAELVRYLATILRCEVALVARYEPQAPGFLRMLAMIDDGEVSRDLQYPIAGTPCETVFGQRYRAYPDQVQQLFPDDHDARAHSVCGYAGHPLVALDGTPLGLIAVVSRQPLVQLERIEAMLQIFAVRAAAEIERLIANEALQRSEASYRAIFEASEDAIFIHDWDTGAILDVNPKACEVYGYGHEELCRASLAELSSGEGAYTAEQNLKHIERAKSGHYPPFEWHRRNHDGSLRWDEVRL
jgi:PAS domain S-box-containing protein